VTSIEAVAELCDADVDGLYPGSKDLVFKPGQLTGGEFEFDVGTAGSISLVLTSCLLPAVLSKDRVRLKVKGGTNVRWSPPIDYISAVHLPLLARFGASCSIDLRTRGFYPEGGGEVVAEIAPSGGLTGLVLTEQGRIQAINGIVYAQNLPEHILTRMKHSAMKKLVDFRNLRIESDLRKGPSTGAGIVLAAECENTVIGATGLGAKGVRAEALGENAASDLVETIASGATVDEHMLDQILPYMAVAHGSSAIIADDLTEHAKTNIWVIERFFPNKFSASKRGELTEIATN
jgi:RNA 3'-phosphate cyclase